MASGSLLRLLKRPFYGWWIVIAGTVAMMFQGGLYFYGFSVFFIPLINEFGWTRAALSGVFSLSRMESGLAGPIEGALTDRFGPRKLMFFGMILMGLGFVVLSRVQSLVPFYLVFIFMVAFGTSLATQTPVATAIANWFVRKRALAFGIHMTGVGIGGLLVPVLTWLVAQAGWRTAAVVTGVLILVLGIPLSLLVRHRPEDYGCLPDGDTVPPQKRESAGASFRPPTPGPQPPAPDRQAGFSAVEAMKTSSFWLLSLSFALRIAATNGVTLHLIPYFTDVGFDAEVAGLFLGATGVISIIGRVGLGWLGDVFDKRRVLIVAQALTAVGILLLIGVQNLWTALIFLVVFSPPYGGAIPLSFAIRGEYFGRKAFGAISGLAGFVAMIGTVGGPFLAGWIFDVTGSYHVAFGLFVALCVMSAVLLLLARPPRK
ncbi:MAG: MFS transporter [Chloroflexi bacterium]|nr:MFS transporter [Chloroflexota bacterium]